MIDLVLDIHQPIGYSHQTLLMDAVVEQDHAHHYSAEDSLQNLDALGQVRLVLILHSDPVWYRYEVRGDQQADQYDVVGEANFRVSKCTQRLFAFRDDAISERSEADDLKKYKEYPESADGIPG